MSQPESEHLAELTQQYHQGLERLKQGRLELERVLNDSDYSHQEHVNIVRQRLRDAEQEIERLEAMIHNELPLPPIIGDPPERSARPEA